LTYACSKGDFDTIRLLIERKAQVNLSSKNGKTSLFIASQKGHLECVNLLIKNAANVHMKSSNQSSPLRTAHWNQHVKIDSFLSCVLIKEFYAKLNELVGNVSMENALIDSIDNEEMFLIKSDYIEVFKMLTSEQNPSTIHEMKKNAHLEYFLSFEFRECLTENILKWLKNEKMQLIISKIKIQETVSDILIDSFNSNSNESKADQMKYTELKQLLLSNEYLNLINLEQNQELKLLKSNYLMNKIEGSLRVVSKYLDMANELFDAVASEKLASLVQTNAARNGFSNTVQLSSIFY
jgi:hypothetical protein